MKDCIYRDTAYSIAQKVVDAIANGEYHAGVFAYDIMDWIDELPAADVLPVKRGKWINDHNGKYSSSGDNYFCSACKDPSLRAFGKPARTNYCPNCGADMREES